MFNAAICLVSCLMIFKGRRDITEARLIWGKLLDNTAGKAPDYVLNEQDEQASEKDGVGRVMLYLGTVLLAYFSLRGVRAVCVRR